jgi:hypothetical protein
MPEKVLRCVRTKHIQLDHHFLYTSEMQRYVRNQPVTLMMTDDNILFFLTLLTRHPFIETFYYSNKLSDPFPVPHGQKNVRISNALNRLNIEEFHLRNGSVGRRWTEDTIEAARKEIFRRYESDNHGGLNEECCQILDRVMLDIEAIRIVHNGELVAQEQAAQAR